MLGERKTKFLALEKDDVDGPGWLVELSSFILLLRIEKFLFKKIAPELFEFDEMVDDDTDDEVK